MTSYSQSFHYEECTGNSAAQRDAKRKGFRKMEFFLEIQPPTVTAQEHKVRVAGGRPRFYDTRKLKNARAQFETLLAEHRPEAPIAGPVELSVDWRFFTKTPKDGEWRTTRPETDNLQKLLKDCMTRKGFWKDDAQVCAEIVTKRWVRQNPGIRIKVVDINDQ